MSVLGLYLVYLGHVGTSLLVLHLVYLGHGGTSVLGLLSVYLSHVGSWLKKKGFQDRYFPGNFPNLLACFFSISSVIRCFYFVITTCRSLSGIKCNDFNSPEQNHLVLKWLRLKSVHCKQFSSHHYNIKRCLLKYNQSKRKVSEANS